MNVETITIALDRYDRHVPFFLNTVQAPKGLRYQALEVGMMPPRRHGIDRHKRILVDLEFDAGESSLGSYIIAKKRGVPLVGVPVFPRRLFSQNHIFVSSSSRLRAPEELTGKRVGIWAFQVTMSVLAKGDLKSFYGVPWEGIRWVTQFPEEMDWSAEGLSVERAPQNRDLADMLIDGEIDAYIHPHPTEIPQLRSPQVRRLMDDPEAECARYFRDRRYYPIMHVLVVKEDRVRKRPSLPTELMRMWEEAKRQAADFYTDPGFGLLAFGRTQFERQGKLLGEDAWPSGLRANRTNLEHFMDYMVDQRLIDRRISIESLFDPSVLDS